MSQRYVSHEDNRLVPTVSSTLYRELTYPTNAKGNSSSQLPFSKVPSAVGSEPSSCAISVTSQKIPRAILIGIDVQIALQIFMEPMHPTNLVSQI